ncbi:hypothetical protein PV08_10500 [Exophiala spinifera]|uniref:Carboxylesterase type B domain-containing protein n=1 Tax=Exophiala spinifera TaxID=91928 RepID=A0A0D2AXL3_9EURO|nr:uncharacterized protein PV08_10500 [Exophiala spinifera]KIW11200.1 hypothetical protein PV08_10500 [Exophiala spinifera]
MGATQSSIQPHILQTERGKLRGLEFTAAQTGEPVYRRYTRVPYAQPPVGDLRWRRPQPLPERWSFNDTSGAPGDYTQFGPVCPQPTSSHTLALVDNKSAAPPISNVEDEDCLYLNIWVPAGKPPEGGWPVQFQIHGGWLQVGNASQTHDHDPFDLFVHSRPRIVVAPTYRLNVFGFLAGRDLSAAIPEAMSGNFGLWDQRAALEWTHANISLFSGDPDNIAVGGLSAGSYSALLQLHHDTYLPADRRIIKRVYLWSNAIAIQPHSTNSTFLTEQFASLCRVHDISLGLSAPEKVALLRRIPAAELIASFSRLKYHTFRASTDDAFVSSTFLSSLHSGRFTSKLAEHDVSIVLGDVLDEHALYALSKPVTDFSDLVVQLENYYPHAVARALVRAHGVSEETHRSDSAAWTEAFGRMVADGQVHASVRGLTHLLLHPPAPHSGLPASNVHRYRIEYRWKDSGRWIRPGLSVCHASDIPIWWASGFRAGFSPEERAAALQFLEPFDRFLYGEEDVRWGGAGGEDRVRLLDRRGHVVEGSTDRDWARGLAVWEAIWNAQKEQVAS